MGASPGIVAGDSDHACVREGEVKDSSLTDLCHAAVSGSAEMSITAIVRDDEEDDDVMAVRASVMESLWRCSALVNISRVLSLSAVENVCSESSRVNSVISGMDMESTETASGIICMRSGVSCISRTTSG